MVFLDRSSGRKVSHLEWRIRVFGVGAILAVVGMYLASRLVIWAAVAVLVAGFLLRFLKEPAEEGPGVEEPLVEDPVVEDPLARDPAEAEEHGEPSAEPREGG